MAIVLEDADLEAENSLRARRAVIAIDGGDCAGHGRCMRRYLLAPRILRCCRQRRRVNPSVQHESSVQNLSSDPRALYQALNALRPDGEHVYTIHELNLRRDVVNVRLIEGKLAFFQPIDGHVTGAVFTGRGHIFATPRDRGERQSIAQFLGVPMVGQDFTRAYLRFTDDTAAEIRAATDVRRTRARQTIRRSRKAGQALVNRLESVALVASDVRSAVGRSAAVFLHRSGERQYRGV